MQMVFKYQKPICLIVLVSLYWFCMPQLSAQAAMITTEDTLDRSSKSDFDLERIKSFVSRKDVIAQLQSYGISSEEAMARVDSLTDQEIALIADQLDQLPVGGSTISAIATAWQISQYVYVGAIIGLIILFFIAGILYYSVNE